MKLSTRTSTRLRLVAAWMTFGALGCHAPLQRDYDEPPLDVPASFAAAPNASDSTAQLDGWWRDFQSAELSQLVDDVLAQNNDLFAATQRLRAARAQAEIAGATLWPAVGAGADAGRQRQNFIGLPLPGGQDVLSSTSSSYGVALNVSWELDLWGKLDARAKAAGAEFEARAADVHGMRLSLAGQTVKTWLTLAEAQRQTAIAAERVSNLEQSVEVVRERFAQGRAPALDLRLIEAELATALARHSAQVEVRERVSRGLEILRGAYPSGSLLAADALPALPAQAPTGLPAELLQRRPDLVAAEATLRAGDFRLFAARKELWPSLSLAASGGRRSSDISDLDESAFNIWSLVGNITQPIFQGGRLTAGIDAAEAEAQALLAEYAQAVLRAFLEVESALAVEQSLSARTAQLQLAVERARDARSLAEERYRAGRSDILIVLTAQRQAFESEGAWVSALREQLDLRVDLYLALGGGFLVTQVNEQTATPASSALDSPQTSR